MTDPELTAPTAQYRTTARTNLRQEPSTASAAICQLNAGVIVHVDLYRTTDVDKDGHRWLPVVIVRGWLRDDVVELVE